MDRAHAFVRIGPASSTGSPMTFMMRPSVPSPTGTGIGAPVSVTGWPRTRPSVVSIEMQRTEFSPRCWATSSTRRLPLFVGLERVQDLRQVAVELHVDDGADHLGDAAGGDACLEAAGHGLVLLESRLRALRRPR